VVTSPSSSVRRARQELAQRLRDIRIEAGLSARAIARAAGWHESKCSRIEHARTAPSAADIRAWCRVCGAESEIPGLLASLHAADSAYVEWRRLAAGGFRHLQNAYVPLYERTQRIGCYQSHVVPARISATALRDAVTASISAGQGATTPALTAAISIIRRDLTAHPLRFITAWRPGRHYPRFTIKKIRTRKSNDIVPAATRLHLLPLPATPGPQQPGAPPAA
jgi:transcriptional regulator with XRE-family HTH domain